MKRMGPPRDEAKRKIVFRMFAQGHTYAAIGQKLGISRQRVQQLVRPPIQVQRALWKRAGNKCERCGIVLRLGDAHIHHIDNNITQTYEDLKRVKLLCRSCHRIEDQEKQGGKP